MSLSSADDSGRRPAGMWSSLARSRVERIFADVSHPPRVAVIGPAGSDKSPMLEWIDAGMHPDAVAAGRTRVVDDAHLLSDHEVAALSEDLDDASVGMVLAARPWPRSEALRQLMRRLEQSAPAIVVGRLDAEDVAATLRADGRSMDQACIVSLVTLASSITWLVKESLIAHGDGPCDDPTHARVTRAMSEVVAERLATVDPEIAHIVRRSALGDRFSAGDDPDEQSIARGYAEGFLLRNGAVAPIVRIAALSTTPVSLLVTLLADHDAGTPPLDVVRSLGDVADPRLAQALIVHADAAAADDLPRALELYEAARDAGADPLQTAVRMSRLAWDRGELNHAAALLDAVELVEDHPDHDDAVDLAGSVWSARGYPDVSAATYGAHDLRAPVVRSHAAVAALAAGDAGPVRERAASSDDLPTTLSVSVRLLMRALRASISDRPDAAIDDAIRASDTYAESGHDGPAPEVPAVVAAVIAINLGELDTARGMLADALLTGHGGAWARPRLLLWDAWTAVHAQRPDECAARLAEVDAAIAPLGPRDIVVRDAVLLAFVRRYGVPGELQSLWERVREDVRGVEPDLFSLLPLYEFLITAADFDDTHLLERVGDGIDALLARLGEPALWTAEARWTAFQQAILVDDLDGADQRARALRELPPTTAVARAVASAATEWLRARRDEALDIGRVVEAATELAAVGFAWDAARLAHLAAAGTEHRKVAARLIALAAELHPNAERSPDVTPLRSARIGDVLSAREREVAALVIAGRTYAEIGEAMFISPRTAEHHIARMRRRLGATSRTDLIAKLRSIVEAG